MYDPNDPEAAKQRPVVRRILTESPSLFVPVTVVLELEWVLRAFYRFKPARIVQVFEHLLGLCGMATIDAGLTPLLLEKSQHQPPLRPIQAVTIAAISATTRLEPTSISAISSAPA